MTSTKGKAQCDRCKRILTTQKERIDVYKRRLGSIKIFKHYCLECFEKIGG